MTYAIANQIKRNSSKIVGCPKNVLAPNMMLTIMQFERKILETLSTI